MLSRNNLSPRRKDAKGREKFCSSLSPIVLSSLRLCVLARVLSVLLTVASLLAQQAQACPFCTAVGPSFAERRAECDVVAVGEARDAKTFRIDQVLQGRDALGDVTAATVADEAATLKPGELAILLGKKSTAWSWE